jgi:hypothetical protein
MKSDKSFDEIGDLLRSRKPEFSTPPGLETRILRALDQRQRPAPKSWWPWLLLPPALAALVLLMWPILSPPHSETTARQAPDSAPSSPDSEMDPAGSNEPVITLADAGDPLTAESDALSRDVQRAGDFLINCLPSVSSAAE